ncbi:hypothetical protein KY325_02425 [Candidatus Woesearchaeota archaeon]|nr:hypothetical protein [Candidatus Woesearchaeota archaeon]MBW3017990.1 hypothetical protein [Candidatus Woesearchaeota archaeon]
MSERRSKFEIIFDILKAIQDRGGRIKPTHLLYKSNLSYKRLQGYMDSLLKKGLVEKAEEGRKIKKSVIVLTDKGYEFLANYNKVREFTEAFGL